MVKQVRTVLLYATKPVGLNYLTFPGCVLALPVISRAFNGAGRSVDHAYLTGWRRHLQHRGPLSSVSRTLNFRLTVRDNRPYVPVTPGPAAGWPDSLRGCCHHGYQYRRTIQGNGAEYQRNLEQRYFCKPLPGMAEQYQHRFG